MEELQHDVANILNSKEKGQQNELNLLVSEKYDNRKSDIYFCLVKELHNIGNEDKNKIKRACILISDFEYNHYHTIWEGKTTEEKVDVYSKLFKHKTYRSRFVNHGIFQKVIVQKELFTELLRQVRNTLYFFLMIRNLFFLYSWIISTKERI